MYFLIFLFHNIQLFKSIPLLVLMFAIFVHCFLKNMMVCGTANIFN